MIEFRIEPFADQKFATILEGRRVSIRLRYNPTVDRWSFDLAIDDEPRLHARRVVTGIDLLAPFNFGVGVIFAAPMVPNAVPTWSQLPNGEVRIFQTTKAEIDAAIS